MLVRRQSCSCGTCGCPRLGLSQDVKQMQTMGASVLPNFSDSQYRLKLNQQVRMFKLSLNLTSNGE